MKTRDRILHSALKLFNERGISDVGVRDIARNLDISPGNLSYHFARKEDLVLALIRDYGISNDRLFQDYLDGTADLRLFIQLLERIFRHQFAHRGLFLSHQELRHMLFDALDYPSTDRRRKALFEKIFLGLIEVRQLRAATDVDFLVRFFSLLGRFWILEDAMSRPLSVRNDPVGQYLDLAVRQLNLFATAGGLKILSTALLSAAAPPR